MHQPASSQKCMNVYKIRYFSQLQPSVIHNIITLLMNIIITKLES